MPDKRTASRRKMVLAVKVTIDRVAYLAPTIDINQTGARLGALRTRLQPGKIISLQRGSKKATFRVAWVRQLAPNELQAGVESLETQNKFWGVDLSAQDLQHDTQVFMTLVSTSPKRRSNP
jgi:hypothetical protein